MGDSTMLKRLIPPDFDGTLRLLMVVGAIASFLWGVFVWNDNQTAERLRIAVEAARNAQTRKIEATKPFLNIQLNLYQEAVRLASVISTSEPSPQRQEHIQDLMRLYWGKLAMVENKEVEGAMVALRDAIKSDEPNEVLQQSTLALARACRRSLDRSWGINAWTAPDEASSP